MLTLNFKHGGKQPVEVTVSALGPHETKTIACACEKIAAIQVVWPGTGKRVACASADVVNQFTQWEIQGEALVPAP